MPEPSGSFSSGAAIGGGFADHSIRTGPEHGSDDGVVEICGQMLQNGDVDIDASITFLRVADFERSHAFYADGLGLVLVLDQGGCRIYQLTDASYLGVCEREDSGSSNVIVTIVTHDVAGWYERLTSAGADVDGLPRDNPDYRIYHFFATDPDGHLIEVQRFWDAHWADPSNRLT